MDCLFWGECSVTWIIAEDLLSDQHIWWYHLLHISMTSSEQAADSMWAISKLSSLLAGADNYKRVQTPISEKSYTVKPIQKQEITWNFRKPRVSLMSSTDCRKQQAASHYNHSWTFRQHFVVPLASANRLPYIMEYMHPYQSICNVMKDAVIKILFTAFSLKHCAEHGVKEIISWVGSFQER